MDALAFRERHFVSWKNSECQLTKARAHLNLSMETQLHHPFMGLIPSEDSSGTRRRLGAISKQGNTLLRTLLVEAGQSAARCDPELRRAYQRLCRKKQHTGTGKVMVARKLALRLCWMLKQQQPYRPAHALSSPSHSVSAA